MSIPPNSRLRGCAVYFPQPMSENDERAVQFLDEHVYYFNCRVPQEPLADIEYRNSSRDLDICCHVFRWDVTPYEQVFENGFSARRQEGTSDDIFFNLDHYVHHGGRPLNSTRATTHAF
ncbi:hypothetical protein SLEP1_g17471 [Rubroshorea leprosula]|uniref:Uncharacterized protein n=1 Tax=Rubroshorea leprosula TaxID=152421 RepID=A0AAV5IUE7_9ROSI|nr:hypothetical protein SLEP1_g17471 [Rubroshorea leprosula]